MGAPVGNQNAAKAKVWAAAINRALEKRAGGDRLKAIDDLAEKFLKACDEGDLSAFKELGDRLDGKPAQAVSVGNEPGEEFVTRIVREIVRTKD